GQCQLANRLRNPLALPRKLPPPLLSLDEHVVRVAEFLFISLAYLAEARVVIGFDRFQDACQARVNVRLQFLREGPIKMRIFSGEYAGIAQSVTMPHDADERAIEAVDGVVDAKLPHDIRFSHGGLRRAAARWGWSRKLPTSHPFH